MPLFILLAACTSADVPAETVSHVGQPCAPFPRETKLLLPATPVQILQWHDTQRAKDKAAYAECARRARGGTT